MRLGLGLGINAGLSNAGLPALAAGYAYVVDRAGNYLVDRSNNYLIVRV
jgi:hypothetical protein